MTEITVIHVGPAGNLNLFDGGRLQRDRGLEASRHTQIVFTFARVGAEHEEIGVTIVIRGAEQPLPRRHRGAGGERLLASGFGRLRELEPARIPCLNVVGRNGLRCARHLKNIGTAVGGFRDHPLGLNRPIRVTKQLEHARLPLSGGSLPIFQRCHNV